MAPIMPQKHEDGHAHPGAPAPPTNVPAKPVAQPNGTINSGIPTFTAREMQNIQGDILYARLFPMRNTQSLTDGPDSACPSRSSGSSSSASSKPPNSTSV